MNDTILENNSNDTFTSANNTQNKHFIDDDNFKTLINTLDKIYDQTQVRPSLKKLVNLIIEKADINKLGCNI